MVNDPDFAAKRSYNAVREHHPELPAWEDLTDEQRARQRAIQREYSAFWDALGEAIRTGRPPPLPP